ncbi:DUF2520 domain-containing protein [Flavobacteriaceae bacterium XHP0103]|uniref:Rossmann-like and DUF2520 domain-containing protein n=1 Tax=Marixanthotalea marina TaxID=2844359 RepID=UPI002989B1DE|nr:DUF2520 domain-containing protein [Marixanthotalea marina]MBU3821563.1 DUF2520 domain-containing protein [Marixanthotalea marina]
MISVIILGAGNVANHLFKAFKKSDQATVKQWYNRSLNTIKQFSNQTEITDNLAQIKDADLYILAVSDDAVKELSAKLPFANRLVVHTSGSVNIHDIDKKHRRGVLYPLQTFSKNSDMDFTNVPICIEAIESEDYHLLKKIAVSLGSPTKKVNSDQRQVLHLAAVFVNNFTNQLYRLGHEISESEAADFDLLKPLILETAKKIEHLSPYMAQTGPAKRNDKTTLKKHLKLLEDKPHHKTVYELLTKSIQLTHGGKKL